MKKKIIEKNTRLIEFLGLTLGPDYEIALYDLELDPPSIVAITNGDITGRSIGSPLTEKAKSIIESGAYLDHDWITNYRGVTPSGKILRCSTFFIKNESGGLVGLLCVSFDDSRYHDVMEVLLTLCHPRQYINKNIAIEILENTEQDMMHNNISLAVDDAVKLVTTALPERMTRGERTQIIRILDQKGIFLLKGAIPLVAKQIGCSVASVYRYLGEIHKNGA